MGNPAVRIAIAFILFAGCVIADPLPYPVGNVTTATGTLFSCPSGFACSLINVNTPNYPCYALAAIAVLEPENPIATDLFFSGSGGGSWWTTTLYPGSTFVQDLLNAGHRIVQISWYGNGWMQKRSCPDNIYPIAAACRPATVIKYVHDRWPNTPLNVEGSSGGSAQIAYSLAFYGAEQWVTGIAVLDSANPFMEIHKGCQLDYPGYTYNSGANAILNAFFFNSLCGSGQVDENWATNSVEYGGNYSYPVCRVQVLVGSSDNDFIKNRGTDYFNLLASGTPNAVFTSVANCGHGFQVYPSGVATIKTLLLNSQPAPTPTVPPLPTATATCTCP